MVRSYSMNNLTVRFFSFRTSPSEQCPISNSSHKFHINLVPKFSYLLPDSPNIFPYFLISCFYFPPPLPHLWITLCMVVSPFVDLCQQNSGRYGVDHASGCCVFHIRCRQWHLFYSRKVHTVHLAFLSDMKRSLSLIPSHLTLQGPL